MYKSLIRPLLFRFDAEDVHHFAFSSMRSAFAVPGAAALADMLYRDPHPRHVREVMGLRFPNPVGLAAGFDKDGLLAEKWAHLGFGFVELGTVTPRPQAGNPRPRLFRLPADQAIINRMGFNNAGVEALAARLEKIRHSEIIIGANIGKNKDTANEDAASDYEICFRRLSELVDYFVVNVSSPNTPGLRALQEKEPLTALLDRLQTINQARKTPRPLLLKIAPDLSEEQLDDIAEVALKTGLSGLIATNTTISRECLRTPASVVDPIGAGGLSGAPLRQRAEEVIRGLRARCGDRLALVGVGGIGDAASMQARLDAGADLVQVYSHFVYEGPGLVRGLLRR
ncbi:MAG: quinone-dependent dihydroorotate dehydrogenase [Bacteroidetes bacterium]|nr:MAG: quinone-dependent dihydroorotate dehydrogenase [Bacteroidota bacterium]